MGKSSNLEVNPLGSTAYQRVRDAIRTDIINGQLVAGKRLTLHTLTKRYQISGAPIREALNQLSGEGLIEIQPNRGARVRAINETMLRNIYDIREALEGFLASHFARSRTNKDIDKLRAAQLEIADAWGNEDATATHLANQRFHAIINGSRGNTEADKLLKRHQRLLAQLRINFGYSGRIDRLLTEHDSIISAVAAGNAQEAYGAATIHVRSAANDMVERFRDTR